MSLRRQLPVWSPLGPGALAAAIVPDSEAPERIRRRIASEYGCAGVSLTASGTVALAVAILAATPRGERPRAALPAWGCPDLMTAADSIGAAVALYDLDPETLGPDLESLRRALSHRVHAVVVAQWFGIPQDLSPLAPELASSGALLIDDAAQAVGARSASAPCGAGGAYGILSFGRGKGRTGGKGGHVAGSGRSAAGDRRLRTQGAVGPGCAMGFRQAVPLRDPERHSGSSPG